MKIQNHVKFMKLTFQQQLNEELLRSEKRRTIIIISIFLFAIVYRLIDMFLFKADEESIPTRSFHALWLFPSAIILFEVFSLLYINKRLHAGRRSIPMVMQYINTGFEICLPSLIILSVAKQYPQYEVLKSPALQRRRPCLSRSSSPGFESPAKESKR